MNDKFKELLQKVRNKPALYIGKPSLELLDAFISGCICMYSEFYDNYSIKIFPDFQDFIQEKYNITSSQRWSRIIQFYSMTEEEAFYKFFELLDEFLQK